MVCVVGNDLNREILNKFAKVVLKVSDFQVQRRLKFINKFSFFYEFDWELVLILGKRFKRIVWHL
jgi:hypothetical protein